VKAQGAWRYSSTFVASALDTAPMARFKFWSDGTQNLSGRCGEQSSQRIEPGGLYILEILCYRGYWAEIIQSILNRNLFQRLLCRILFLELYLCWNFCYRIYFSDSYWYRGHRGKGSLTREYCAKAFCYRGHRADILVMGDLVENLVVQGILNRKFVVQWNLIRNLL
jgi:hypothetical protein